MPDMEFIQSTNIEAYGYDPATLELHVRFLKTGETYVHYHVEEWRYAEMRQADRFEGHFSEYAHQAALPVREAVTRIREVS